MQWKSLIKRSNLDKPEDRAILFICMGIALLFWIFIKLSQEYSAVKPVQFQVAIPENKTLINPPPKDMKIEMRGSGWDILYDFFLSSTVDLEFNLQEQEVLNRSRNQLLSDIRNQLYSRNLEIRTLNYDGIQFRLDDKVRKKVPVRLLADLDYAPGYQAKEQILLNPDSVTVIGPASLLDSIQLWRTDSLILSGISINLNQSIDLQVPPPSVFIEPNEINFSVSVEQFTENTVFVPLKVENAPDSILRIFPKNVSVNYIVGISQFNTIESESFQIIADFSTVDITKPGNKVPLKMILQPPSVRNVSFTPKTADFFILKDSLEQKMENQ